MHGISVALLTEDHDHLTALQNRLEATRLARVVFSQVGFPVGPTDAIVRQIQDLRAEVVLSRFLLKIRSAPSTPSN